MLAPALALALPLPAEPTIHIAMCGLSGGIDIPLDGEGDGKPGEKRFACHALGCERSRGLRARGAVENRA
jgi:hypothetical protein